VSEVALNAETFRADTTVSLGTGIEIPDDSAIVISSEGLLGGNFVEIVPGGSPFFFEPGDTIEDTQGAVSLVSLLLKFVSGSSE
jgi:phospholipid/cholesterol/gamma-HCH transport system substrate-binding protein